MRKRPLPVPTAANGFSHVLQHGPERTVTVLADLTEDVSRFYDHFPSSRLYVRGIALTLHVCQDTSARVYEG